MSPKNTKNLPSSVLARLLNLAKQTGDNYQVLLTSALPSADPGESSSRYGDYWDLAAWGAMAINADRPDPTMAKAW